MEKLKQEINEHFEEIKRTVPCNFAGCELWSDCKICNGMRNDETQPAHKCPAWIPKTAFRDYDP